TVRSRKEDLMALTIRIVLSFLYDYGDVQHSKEALIHRGTGMQPDPSPLMIIRPIRRESNTKMASGRDFARPERRYGRNGGIIGEPQLPWVRADSRLGFFLAKPLKSEIGGG